MTPDPAWTPSVYRRLLGLAIRPKERRPSSLLVKALSWIRSPSSSRPEPITRSAQAGPVSAGSR